MNKVDPGQVDSILASTSIPGRLYVTTADRSLYIGRGTPFVWHKSPTGIPGMVLYALGKRDVLLAAEQALYRSKDNGRSWRRLSCGLILTGVAVSPRDPRTIYIATNPSDDYEQPGLGGLYRTTDAGGEWKRFTRFPRTSPKEPTVNVVAVDPSAPQHVYIGTEGGGLLRSIDGGEHWTFSRIANEGAGLDGPQLTSLAFVAGPTPVLWAGSSRQGIFRADAQTLHWSSRGLRDVGGISQILPDPRRPNIVYVLTGHGAVRTLDGGRHWESLKGLPSDVSSLSISPADEALYAAAGRRVYRSRTAGTRWMTLPTLPRP